MAIPGRRQRTHPFSRRLRGPQSPRAYGGLVKSQHGGSNEIGSSRLPGRCRWLAPGGGTPPRPRSRQAVGPSQAARIPELILLVFSLSDTLNERKARPENNAHRNSTCVWSCYKIVLPSSPPSVSGRRVRACSSGGGGVAKGWDFQGLAPDKSPVAVTLYSLNRKKKHLMLL